MKRNNRFAAGSYRAIEKLLASYSLDNRTLSPRIGRFSLATGVVLVMLLAASFGQTSSALTGVVAITSSDAWAVGNTNTVSSRGIVLAKTLAEHWNGTKWTVIPTPNPQGRCNTFSALAAVASNDVWAVGTGYNNASNFGNGSNFSGVRRTLGRHRVDCAKPEP